MKHNLADKNPRNFTFKGTKSSGSFAYYFQRISGAVLVVLLFVHYYMMHSTTMGGHSHEETVRRLNSFGWQAFYLSFIFLGLYHGLNGVWNIVQDYDLSARSKMIIYIFLVLFGIIFGAIGALTIINIPQKFAGALQ
jgi:succinate dehydrogenase / fumarate reductase membrane anchor subunit